MSQEIKTTPRRNSKIEFLIAVTLALLALALYLLTLAPTVLLADPGEFQFVAWLPGIAHPTGYPLYTMLGWLWTHLLPVGEVAWRMNLFSAVGGALTVGTTFLVARLFVGRVYPDSDLVAQRIAAGLTATMLATNSVFWSQAIIAEVYTLHSLFIALIIGLALQTNDSPQTLKVSKTFRVLALIFGLGLTHHVTTILLLPGLLGYWVLTYRTVPNIKKRLPHLISCLALATIPLLLYLYLPIIAPSTPYRVLSLSESQQLVLYDNTLTGLLQHITGTVFTGELRPEAVGFARFGLVWTWFQQQFGWQGIALTLIGGLSLIQRRQWPLLALTSLSLLALLTFNLIYFIGDVYVLFIPVWFFVCLWLGLGSLSVGHGLAALVIRNRAEPETNSYMQSLDSKLQERAYQLLLIMFLIPFLIWPMLTMISQFDSISQADNTHARDGWQKILAEPLPQGAILLSNDRNDIMPMWYYQYVDQQRPDLIGLFPLIITDPAYANVGRLLDQALRSERPVYLIKPMDGLRLKASLMPTGTLFRARPYLNSPDHPTEINLAETMKLVGYDTRFEQTIDGKDDKDDKNDKDGTKQLIVTLHWQAIQPLTIDYSSYVHLLDEAGNGVTQHDYLPGGIIYPSHYWQLGEIIRDEHQLALQPNLPPGNYQLRAGMYHQPDLDQFENLGDGQIIGQITITPK
ncbi:DUF2723 domain-containing protein [Anaerolineales bacterium HSG24]|nr:DUF2723 domain-containing protein [Anaerolineales bacterium HSG24]